MCLNTLFVFLPCSIYKYVYFAVLVFSLRLSAIIHAIPPVLFVQLVFSVAYYLFSFFVESFVVCTFFLLRNGWRQYILSLVFCFFASLILPTHVHTFTGQGTVRQLGITACYSMILHAACCQAVLYLLLHHIMVPHAYSWFLAEKLAINITTTTTTASFATLVPIRSQYSFHPITECAVQYFLVWVYTCINMEKIVLHDNCMTLLN